jgi:hypothetical protein
MAKRNETKREPAAPVEPGQPNHDEWLLDESVEETFPASDPATLTRPGSTLARRYETTKKAAGAKQPASRRAKRRSG